MSGATFAALAKPALAFLSLFFLLLAFKKENMTMALSGWLLLVSYWLIEFFALLKVGESFDAAVAFLVLLFSALLAWHAATCEDSSANSDDAERRRFLVLMAKVSFICGMCYFPFSEIEPLGTLLIYVNAALAATTINFLHGIGLLSLSVRVEFPAFIHAAGMALPPIEIILACTAIQSIVIFTGIIFGVEAPLNKKIKAFLVSVPVIFVLNVFRNVFVTAAYFGTWFGSAPLESFYIAHHILARIFVLATLIIIAYAVFVILPETLDLVEKLLTLPLGGRRRGGVR